jgi:hypothetical protein
MPMELDRYPDNWNQLSLKIRRDAEWNCQKCGKPCRMPSETVEDFAERLPEQWHAKLFKEIWDDETGEHAIVPAYPGRFCLTVGHLDQNPGNNEVENLLAMCAPCHLNYDRNFIQSNAYAKRERNGQTTLFQK